MKKNILHDHNNDRWLTAIVQQIRSQTEKRYYLSYYYLLIFPIEYKTERHHHGARTRGKSAN